MNNKMYYNQFEESDDSYESDNEELHCKDSDNEELHCKNIDPSLAKLMGIIIQEQKEIDWKPPLKSGLDNSEEILSANYLKNKHFLNNDMDYFDVIKYNILNYKTLNDKQIEYIKNLNNDEKFELIQIYNKLMNNRIK